MGVRETTATTCEGGDQSQRRIFPIRRAHPCRIRGSISVLRGPSEANGCPATCRFQPELRGPHASGKPPAYRAQMNCTRVLMMALNDPSFEADRPRMPGRAAGKGGLSLRTGIGGWSLAWRAAKGPIRHGPRVSGARSHGASPPSHVLNWERKGPRAERWRDWRVPQPCSHRPSFV